jgi:M6 family metalloprotease-like protein
MRKKIIGIFLCMLLLATGVVPLSSAISESNVKKSLDAPVSFYRDYDRTPLYKRSLQDIISGKPLQSLEGSQPLLVILASLIFDEPNASHTVDYFDKMLFGPRPSLSDYYSEVSYGKFTYSRADIRGWYKIHATKIGAVINPGKFVVKAIKAADKDINFAIYDTNNDGVVTNEELTIIIVPTSVWPYSKNQKIEDGIPTNDGVVLVEGAFNLIDEWEPIGVFAHELGHRVGVPDEYDYDFDSNGVGQYSLMSSGGYGYIHMSAWCKIQLGWIIPTVITTNGTYTLNDAETHAEALILCDLKHSALEYFLIENRYKGTSYDSISEEWYDPVYKFYNIDDLPDEGILIYHIDENQAIRWYEEGLSNVNDIEEHKAVDVECADSPSSHFLDADDLDSTKNMGDENDLWDSTTYDFDDFSSPCNATWYDGTPSGFAIRDFSASGPTMTMYISNNYENQPPNIPTITGQKSGKVNTSYKYDVSTTDPEGGLVYYSIDWGDGSSTGWIGPKQSGSTQEIMHSWAEKDTYSVKVKAKDSFGVESDWGTLTVTMPYSYNKPIPQFLQMLFQRFPTAFPLLRQLFGD